MRSSVHGHRWMAVILVVLVSGCATPPQTLNLSLAPPAVPARAEIDTVPFYPQRDYQCGPAALAMLINYYRPETDAQALVEHVYIPAVKGSLQAEMIAAARSFGRLAIPLDGRLESILREVAAGHPVLVLQNLGVAAYPFWHYAVVVGYDLPRREIVLRSGEIERLVRPMAVFERTWRRASHWAFVAVPPDRMPASVSELAFERAATALEGRGTVTLIARAYRTGLARWPDNFVLRMGLGNAYYAQHDYAAAALEFERVTKDHPQRAEGWNNLGYARWQQGRVALAEQAIRQALRLQPGNPVYLDSLREITGSDSQLTD